ncbi:MAG: hypothetical protein A3F67_11190 [Verrucomicrobia bacterium RIFCSPHIGHO2_12_FULL_41_10]|nr:MAG: hypothetical protein A3F67_11190 [Verrucomicrobia bacterium RIFCSPHIGHO2_12_FULL_41_10]
MFCINFIQSTNETTSYRACKGSPESSAGLRHHEILRYAPGDLYLIIICIITSWHKLNPNTETYSDMIGFFCGRSFFKMNFKY